MREVLCMAVKDLRLLVRDRVALFFALVCPLLYSIFFGTIFSGAGRGEAVSAMGVVVVDEDASEQSRAFIETLKTCRELRVATAASAGEAADLVRLGRQTAYVVVPPGFGAARQRLFYGDPPRLVIGVDPARQAEGGMLQGILTQQMVKGIQEAFTHPELMKQRMSAALAELRAAPDVSPAFVAILERFFASFDAFVAAMQSLAEGDSDGQGGFHGFEPVVFEKQSVVRQRRGPQNSYAVSFPQGIIWGVMGCAAGFGISLVTERTRGTLVRLRTAPVQRWHILGGKAAACLITTLIVTTGMLAVAVAAFGVRPNAPWLLPAAVISVSLGFVGIMMLLAVLGKTEQAAGGIGWAILTVLAMIGGGMVPVFFMPGWMQALSSISPVKWAIVAMEGALWRGFSPAEMLLPCTVLIAVGAACFLIGTRAFQWTDQS